MNGLPKELQFRKSSFCESNACVEVAVTGDMIVIRDSKRPTQTLIVSRSSWEAFAAGVRASEFEN